MQQVAMGIMNSGEPNPIIPIRVHVFVRPAANATVLCGAYLFVPVLFPLDFSGAWGHPTQKYDLRVQADAALSNIDGMVCLEVI